MGTFPFISQESSSLLCEPKYSDSYLSTGWVVAALPLPVPEVLSISGLRGTDTLTWMTPILHLVRPP